MTRKRRSNRGFTLVELMIVVVILLILSAIAIPIYLNYVDDARRSQAAADMKIVAGSLSKMYTDVGAAPIKTGGTTPCGDPVLSFKPSNQAEFDTYFPAGSSLADWKGPYLNTWPEGPKGWKRVDEDRYQRGIRVL
ncbi:MAG: prepilin-type N-terminal cleavage/methylation domain-containing protein [Armatimonadetes bacterium]|nr:prepilin-type N-terminal cleavage/methylation domain-containing protein [Armatimonadota bacterium]